MRTWKTPFIAHSAHMADTELLRPKAMFMRLVSASPAASIAAGETLRRRAMRGAARSFVCEDGGGAARS